VSIHTGSRRGIRLEAADCLREAPPLSAAEVAAFEELDLIYRALVALLYNYVPTSGHPGGSISSGRAVAAILFDGLDHDVRRPDRDDADIVSYAAGHKALGLYALWALRDEIARIARPELLPADGRDRLRLEDLLGFRRNPATTTPLFRALRVKALDGHPTPATPFVRLATGASGVGMASSLGLAIGARDTYGADAPRVHVIEGEGGLTPGRVAEALAAAGTAGLGNLIVHVDWNQSSIDSDQVCRDENGPGEYVPWDPMELFHLHDWNVLHVADGLDFASILAAQRRASALPGDQPTAIVYRTRKGWRYGIEGRASHGAGHALCSDGFHAALRPLLGDRGPEWRLPSCRGLDSPRCAGSGGAAVLEQCQWDAVRVIRAELEARPRLTRFFAERLLRSRERLDGRGRSVRAGAPAVANAYELAEREAATIPETLSLAPGTATTLRNELGRALDRLNRASGGALFVSAADLLVSTSVNRVAEGFPRGFWHATGNPDARTLAIGGICEDAMAGVCSGLAAFGRHVGVASSYAAFIAPLGHIAARLHAIGSQARRARTGEPCRPMILVAAHAGLKTGEDGPTHADPQALQLVAENFPPGTAITLTPWEPQEVWPLLATALARRPAVIVPFVTRPNELVPDRAQARLAPATAAVTGVYRLRASRGTPDVVLVLQESAVTLEFVRETLPRLDRDGVDVAAYAVTSPELFDGLPRAGREAIFPESLAQRAMGITGFTLPTMYRWIRSDRGREATLHPYRNGHFPGSGQGAAVLREAGLDGQGQYAAVRAFLDSLVRAE
jgi:transketolase